MAAMQVAVLGLGRFGEKLAEVLEDLGHQVMAIDSDEAVVEHISEHVSRAVIADMTDLDALKALHLDDVDVAVLATGDLEASVLAMMNLQELNIQKVYAKVSSDHHEKILKKLGALRCIKPEAAGAESFAHLIPVESADQFLPLTKNYGIGLFPIPPRWSGETVAWAESLLGDRRILALVQGEDVLHNLAYNRRLQPDDLLVLAARDEEMAKPLPEPPRGDG